MSETSTTEEIAKRWVDATKDLSKEEISQALESMLRSGETALAEAISSIIAEAPAKKKKSDKAE